MGGWVGGWGNTICTDDNLESDLDGQNKLCKNSEETEYTFDLRH